MTKINAAITSVGHYLPKNILTNKDLEKIVDTSNKWILERTGISERRIMDKRIINKTLPLNESKGSSFMGSEAAKECLERRGISAKEIDLIIFCTVTPDMMFPATACLVQNNIGADKAWGYDLSAGCSGFLYGLMAGTQFIKSGAHKKVLVIGADMMSSILNYEDRNTCILFGDGAGCVLLEPTEEEEGVLDFTCQVDGGGGEFLKMEAGGSRNPTSHKTVDEQMHYVYQDGRTVFKHAVSRMAEVSVKILEQNNLEGKDVDLFIPHQANIRIIDATAKRMGIDSSKVLINIQKYGNTTAATLPLGMYDAVNDGRLTKGSNLILTTFGTGFTWGSCYIKWNY
ncbi:MAG: ketoacyl-ACP synthase III [Calditrichaeota bacterium]|nr:MAG: ketoacyl-ACP synthase III [Calditrichota bacterium]